MDRVHLALLARPDLGDIPRVLLWFSALAAYPVVVFTVALATLVLVARR